MIVLVLGVTILENVFIFVVCFCSQASSIGIHHVEPFYESQLFKDNHFVYDPQKKIIIQAVPEIAVPSDAS